MAFPETLDSVEDDLNTDKPDYISSSPDEIRSHADSQEKDTIGKAGQCVNLAIAIRKASIRAPLAHDCGCQTDGKTSAVKKHVYTVGEQAQRAANEAVEELNYHEAEIEDAKVGNAPRVPFDHNAVKDRSRCRPRNDELGDS